MIVAEARPFSKNNNPLNSSNSNNHNGSAKVTPEKTMLPDTKSASSTNNNNDKHEKNSSSRSGSPKKPPMKEREEQPVEEDDGGHNNNNGSHNKKVNSSSRSATPSKKKEEYNPWASNKQEKDRTPWKNKEASAAAPSSGGSKGSSSSSGKSHHKKKPTPANSLALMNQMGDSANSLQLSAISEKEGGSQSQTDDDNVSVGSNTSITLGGSSSKRSSSRHHSGNLAALATGPTPLVETHVAVRVMKGEIHNVLTAMRSSDQSYISAQRFAEELTAEHHPLVLQFQELHAALSDWDLQRAAQALYRQTGSHHSKHNKHLPAVDLPDGLLYLPPFCAAISTREINAPVTGACLTALHKFLLYGLVHPARDAKQGMTLIARALLHCTFEETASLENSTHGAQRRFRSLGAKSISMNNNSNKLSSDASVGSRGSNDNATKASFKTQQSNNKLGKGGEDEAAAANHPYYHPTRVDDEQVVLKLLELAAMVVRCSFMGPDANSCLITSDLVVGLLDTCLHVSHIAKQASPLLKSAANDALAQIVLQVFCQHPGSSGSSSRNNNSAKAREQVLAKLASLLNPANHDEQVVIAASLTAVNIALETSKDEDDSLTSREIAILQNDLCKYLLQWSTTTDLHILSLTLRVIFNLFQSIQNHLKVPLEVFLTSVHLRILDDSKVGTSIINYEEREVVLESILEFCQEPALMQDLYRNYDCDVACTNLYELIVGTLGRVALPHDVARVVVDPGNSSVGTAETATSSTTLTTSTSGLSSRQLALMNSSSSRHLNQIYNSSRHLGSNSASARNLGQSSENVMALPASTTATEPTQVTTQETEVITTGPLAPITQLNKLALEGLLAILNSIARRVHADRSPFLQNHLSELQAASNPMGRDDSSLNDSTSSFTSGTAGMNASYTASIADFGLLHTAQNGLSEEELQQRRTLKNALVQVADQFNEDFMGQAWLDMAVNLDALSRPDSASGVAQILYSSGGLDKAKVGLYLSKGPEAEYPFHTKVRQKFVHMYDFSGLAFAAALRLFLSKFRLPGEAQCIDRFMEAFSNEYHAQHEKDTKAKGKTSLFKDADAIYVLSFSTIMLNTDLHNPGIKDANRMTLEQFIKNNRGINGGHDLPESYLSELYDEIKQHQIQVQRDVGEFMKKDYEEQDFRSAWDSILTKHRDVADAFFTKAGDARKHIFKAGRHDGEMFQVLRPWAWVVLPTLFQRSADDAVVFKALRGLKQMAMICDFYQLDHVVNDIIHLLLTQGRDYVFSCILQDHNPALSTTPPANEKDGKKDQNTSSRSLNSEGGDSTLDGGEDEDDEEEEDHIDARRIPYSLLSSGGKGNGPIDFTGAACHRGLLALDTGFWLVRRYAPKVTGSSWPLFIECLCAMRDAKALPAGLADLDDFADSNGNVLPLSPYARMSQRRLDQFYAMAAHGGEPKKRALGPVGGLNDADSNKSWFTKLFAATPTPQPSQEEDLEAARAAAAAEAQQNQPPQDGVIVMSEATRAVLGVAEAANVEKIVQMGSTKLPVADTTIRNLLDVVDEYPYEDDPVAEQHAIFSLELAARALLSNRERAVQIFPVFLGKFERILGQLDNHGTTASSAPIPSPFVIERIVVTILRCSIHLYEVEELRPNLRVSLHLLVMSVPKPFVRDVADRMACGLAIILRASFPFFESHNEWTFMGDTLDTLAHYGTARVFVFDGIASTVECAMPEPPKKKKKKDKEEPEPPAPPVYPLTKEGCGALSRILIRFVLGFYQADFSLSVPASVCLEKVYQHMNGLLLGEQMVKHGETPKEDDSKTRVMNKDYWQNVAVALYSICRSPDPDVSRQGYEICQRVILQTHLREIPPPKWLAILFLMVNKQPPTAADLSRANTFVLLGNALMRVLPYLSKRQRPLPDDDLTQEKYKHAAELSPEDQIDGEDLTDLMRLTASLAGENLRHGRRGHVSPLFEKTLQTVTYLSNHMQTDEWKGDKEFGQFASELLLAELEKVGAAGGSAQNQAATQGGGKDDDDDDDDDDDKQEGNNEDGDII